jgi:hypothetical protein
MAAWKPRARIRADEGQWWQDLVPGHAASNVGEEPDDDYFAAMIYLPDPSVASGWQLHGVERKKDEAKKPPLGFRREG